MPQDGMLTFHPLRVGTTSVKPIVGQSPEGGYPSERSSGGDRLGPPLRRPHLVVSGIAVHYRWWAAPWLSGSASRIERFLHLRGYPHFPG